MYSSGDPIRYGHQTRGLLSVSALWSAGVKRTRRLSRGKSETGWEKRAPSMDPRTTPETGRSVPFFTSAVTVRPCSCPREWGSNPPT